MRTRRLAVLATVALALAAVVVGAAVGSSGAAAGSAKRSRPAIALRAARALVRRVNLPPSARRRAALTSYRKDAWAEAFAQASWTDPGSPRAVLSYVRRHPPSGSHLAWTGSDGDPGQVGSEILIAYAFPPQRPVLDNRVVQVFASWLRNGATRIVVGGQSDWIVPRPASEHIPVSVSRIHIAGQVFIGGRSFHPHRYLGLTVTNRRSVERVVRVVNALPLTPPIPESCPAPMPSDRNPERIISMTFIGHGVSRPVARLVYDRTYPGPGGDCDPVALTIRGRPRHPLIGGTFLRAIGRIVGRPLT